MLPFPRSILLLCSLAMIAPMPGRAGEVVVTTSEALAKVSYVHPQTGGKTTDTYKLEYKALLDEHRWETGGVSGIIDGKLRLIDDRTCHQRISGRVDRTVFYLHPVKSALEMQSKFHHRIVVAREADSQGPYLGNALKGDNCNDVRQEFDANVAAAKDQLVSELPRQVAADRVEFIKVLRDDYKTVDLDIEFPEQPPAERKER